MFNSVVMSLLMPLLSFQVASLQLRSSTIRRLQMMSSIPTVRQNLKVGIFGGGVVGGGVYELVQKCTESGRFSSIGANIEVKKICVKSIDKPRDFTMKGDTKLVTNYDDILNDDSINCVVELMGGVTRYENNLLYVINLLAEYLSYRSAHNDCKISSLSYCLC